ncbi:GNAT family N-acetyltransferase [Pontibacter akesuensis]|uniref:Phosphinothricin acetyltransferase n=1 Tax=Pontibacter akesuensis TaxID=388950 RepID=A0A1I7K3D0_9BACT|nr:GNAT family N-acetyltransferase [Pontibacter akesuensis]GHA75377.1 phosphinothricin N-acetyltransferase [Pontibacter akesuensis]SFU91948.1 phosphinothricin acetyltransferase [Pontibacter akesuensis]
METTTQRSVLVSAMLAEHYPQVKEIYERGMATNNATLETKAPEWAEWDAKHLKSCRFVATVEGRVVGWAALSPVSGRCVYGGVAEDSVYVHPDSMGQGIGKRLLQELVPASEQAGIWMLQAHILVENTASIKLHAQCGFRTVGVRERLGQLHGQWRDTCLMERRSNLVGV